MKARSFPRIDRTYTAMNGILEERYAFGWLPFKPRRTTLANSTVEQPAGIFRTDIKVSGNATGGFVCKDIIWAKRFVEHLEREISNSKDRHGQTHAGLKSSTHDESHGHQETKSPRDEKYTENFKHRLKSANRIWRPPLPWQLGIPEPLAWTLTASHQLQVGDVVNIGDIVAEYEYNYFTKPRPNSDLKMSLYRPKVVSRRFQVLAPVEGIVMSSTSVPGRTKVGGYEGLIDSGAGKVPIILLTEYNEEKDTEQNLELSRAIQGVIRSHWKENTHMDGHANADHPDYLIRSIDDGNFWKISADSAKRDKAYPQNSDPQHYNERQREERCMRFLNGDDVNAAVLACKPVQFEKVVIPGADSSVLLDAFVRTFPELSSYLDHLTTD